MERKGFIGGTDAAPIVGLSDWKTAADVWLEKTGRYKPTVDNAFVYWGRKLETLVANEYAKETGRRVERVNRMLKHPEHPFIGGHIDRRVVGQPGMLEVKTTSQDWSGVVPVVYQLQCQHYLAVTGYNWCDVAVLANGRDFWWTRLERDDETITEVVEAEVTFWHDHVLKDVQPSLDYGHKHTKRLLDILNPGVTPTTVELPDELRDTAAAYARLMEEIKDHKREQKALDEDRRLLENQLREAMGTAGVMTWGDEGHFKRSWIPEADVAFTRNAYSRFTFKPTKRR